MVSAYYNEIDPFAAQWLRNLIAAGHIAPGDVDERSVEDVQPDDLAGYTQCHFFAGIGVWSHALRLAGWPDDAPVWTGSCPCQPFSAAGKRGGFGDRRHLWPAWSRLIKACRPPVIFGEQVASAGTIGPSSHLQPMPDREAVRRVLSELERKPALEVQGLHGGHGVGSQTRLSEGRESEAEGVARQPSWPRLGERRPPQGQDARIAVRSRPSGHSEPDRGGPMRDDRYSVRPDEAESMERSLSGPDPTREGVHDWKRESGPLCPECDGEYVGTAADRGDCECDLAEADGALERLVGSLGGSPQAASGRTWFDAVQADLEEARYAVGSVVLPAAGFGAPHGRHRIYFVADATAQRLPAGARVAGQRHAAHEPERSVEAGELADTGRVADASLGTRQSGEPQPVERVVPDSDGEGAADWSVADADGRNPGAEREQRGREHGQQQADGGAGLWLADHQGDGRDEGRRPLEERARLGDDRELGDTDDAGSQGRFERGNGADERAAGPSGVAGFWRDAEWLWCADQKYRPTQPGLFPLAHGAPARVGRLRAYGNAIVAPVAAEFIRSYIEAIR